MNGPVTDPWFAASTPLSVYYNDTSEGGSGGEFFVADEPASVIACATTTEICNPLLKEGPRCVTAFQNDTLRETLATIWTNDDDRAGVQGALTFLAEASVFDADMFYTMPSLPTLQTQYSLSGPLSGPVQGDLIPSDRWQLEMVFIFQASLASLQAVMVERATGQLLWEKDENNENGEAVGCVPFEACRAVCERQMIRSPGHYSFSLLGVFIIIFLGGAFIVVGFFIEWIALRLDWLKNIGNRGPSRSAYAQAEWQTGSPLQLQRLAHEALGLGAWSGADAAIPVTGSGDMLGVLDVSDEKHPRLVHPTHYSNPVAMETIRDEEKQPAVTSRLLTKDEGSIFKRDGSQKDSTDLIGSKV